MAIVSIEISNSSMLRQTRGDLDFNTKDVEIFFRETLLKEGCIIEFLLFEFTQKKEEKS